MRFNELVNKCDAIVFPAYIADENDLHRINHLQMMNDKFNKLFPNTICTTWASGCKAINKTDWTQNDDVPTETQTKWQTYRQQLRDLPATASPTLDSDYNLNFSSVNWPTEPS